MDEEKEKALTEALEGIDYAKTFQCKNCKEKYFMVVDEKGIVWVV